MQKTSVLITGATGALGSAFAESLSASPDIDLHLTDVDAMRLGFLAARTGAIRTMAVNLFDENAEMHNAVTRSEADVVVWNAAINVDQSQPVCDRSLLRERQNASLLRRIEAFEESNTARRRLLVVVNSVTALFGQNPDITNFWNHHADELQLHYGRMKGEQAAMLRVHRDRLREAGVDLSVLYPGSINSPFTNVEKALRSANSLARRMPGTCGREDWKQPHALEPAQVAHAVRQMIVDWIAGAGIPEARQEWVMLCREDL